MAIGKILTENGLQFLLAFCQPQSLNTVKQTYPQAAIIKVEKEWGNYKIKLNNFMELYITASGQLVGQKFDD